jgi:hypothetical protein
MTTTTTTTTTRVRSRFAASLAALAFLGLATACGAQSTVTDQPAPRVQPSGSTPTGFPPPVRNGSGPADASESGGIQLRRSAQETLERVAQHEARYHGDSRPGRP